MKYFSKESTDYTPLPEGAHRVVCSGFIDLGMQDVFGKNKPQFLLRLEFPDCRIEQEMDGQRVSRPEVKYQFYTSSLNQKSNLRRDLEGILARGMTKQKLENGYDTTSLLGKAWQVTIIHDHSGDPLRWKTF